MYSVQRGEIMAKTIAITISDAAHKRLTDVQKRMNKIRREKVKCFGVRIVPTNQTEAMEWILKHTLMPISDFTEGSEGVD